jgi:hypothetical protein
MGDSSCLGDDVEVGEGVEEVDEVDKVEGVAEVESVSVEVNDEDEVVVGGWACSGGSGSAVVVEREGEQKARSTSSLAHQQIVNDRKQPTIDPPRVSYISFIAAVKLCNSPLVSRLFCISLCNQYSRALEAGPRERRRSGS